MEVTGKLIEAADKLIECNECEANSLRVVRIFQSLHLMRSRSIHACF